MPPPRFFHEARLTLALGLPMMAGQVGQMLMGLADTVMVGRVGVLPLASAAFAVNILSFFYIIGVGLQIPVSILSSHAHGAGDRQEAGQVLRHGAAIGLGSGLLIVLGVDLASLFLDHFGQATAVVVGARPFLRIVAWSLVAAMVELNLKQFCEALGRPLLPMTITLSAVGVNVFLNWVLIYGHLGAPALGLVGAGWSTLTARLLSVTVLLLVILRSGYFQAELPKRWLQAVEWLRIGRMLRLGFPISLSLLLEVAAFGMASIMMGWISPQTLAAHQIAINCAATTFMFPLGLSFAVSIRVGHAVGSGERARLPLIGFSAMTLAAVVMGTFALVFLTFGQHIAGWFVEDAAVVTLAGSLLSVAGIFQLFDGWQVVGSGALRGLSDVRVPTLAAFTAYWLIALPGAYWLGFVQQKGALGIWWALAAGLAAAALFAMTRFWFLTRSKAAPVVFDSSVIS